MNSFTEHLFEYRTEDGTYCLTVAATSEADARRRLAAAAQGKYRGSHCQRIIVPAYVPGVGLWVRLVTWWKNVS